MNIFEQVKQQVNVFDVINRYGPSKLDRHNKMCCPFHQEKTASFSVKKDGSIYRCFGCDKKGDSIQYVVSLFDLTPIEAVKQMNDDFGLGLNLNRDYKVPAVKREIREWEENKYLLQHFLEWEEKTYFEAAEKFRLCNELLSKVEPFSEEYCQLVHIRDVQGYITDAILNQHTEVELLLYAQENGGDDDKR